MTGEYRAIRRHRFCERLCEVRRLGQRDHAHARSPAKCPRVSVASDGRAVAANSYGRGTEVVLFELSEIRSAAGSRPAESLLFTFVFVDALTHDDRAVFVNTVDPRGDFAVES